MPRRFANKLEIISSRYLSKYNFFLHKLMLNITRQQQFLVVICGKASELLQMRVFYPTDKLNRCYLPWKVWEGKKGNAIECEVNVNK